MNGLVTLSFSLSPLFVYMCRLVHPLSPRGKLVHWGLEGLAGTDRLIKLAGKDCVLASKLYRLALTERNVQDLSQTAQELPDLCYWMDNEEIKNIRWQSTNMT